MAATPKKHPVDWDVVEPHYRAGIRSLKDIGAEYSVSDAAIIKHAKKFQWTRNLKAKIQARAQEKVSAAMVSAEVSARTKITEAVRIDIESNVLSRVQLSHRRDIGRSRNIVMTLLSELEAVCGTENAALLAELGDMMRRPDQHGQDKFNDLYQKLVSLPGRAKTMKDLGDSLKTMIGLEREAFSLNDAEEGANTGREMSDAELAVRLFDVFGDKLK